MAPVRHPADIYAAVCASAQMTEEPRIPTELLFRWIYTEKGKSAQSVDMRVWLKPTGRKVTILSVLEAHMGPKECPTATFWFDGFKLRGQIWDCVDVRGADDLRSAGIIVRFADMPIMEMFFNWLADPTKLQNTFCLTPLNTLSPPQA